MTPEPIYVGEEIDPSLWPPLPVADRIMVGGETVWLGPFQVPLVVAQPNRWGMAEPFFPSVPCLVEADPHIAGLLARPTEVVGWMDRAHRPIDAPAATPGGRTLVKAAARLAKMIDQIKGVHLVTAPEARTVALTTPLEASELIARCGPALAGIRPLDGLAGAVAVVVAPDHSAQHLATIAAVLRQAVESTLHAG